MKTLANYHFCNDCLIGEKTFQNILIGPGKLPGLSRNGTQDRGGEKHAFKAWPGQFIEPPTITRSRLDPATFHHFLDFISSPFYCYMTSGSRNGNDKAVKLNGDKIEIPNVMRTVTSSRLIQLYQTYCV